ncbi:sigma-70 family RNA polymerase sigma factor [Kribbella sp. CA-293567]|uniref:sigma-70 family RNA polymerase sigma factor n=1 Tax=Kribbella sp. CA-293567 TaxID=3002436 RepID=UPI0022DE27DF|nr:sigma-70 family RNA polymerase sigma factor [Kribbella sp. CA-293567]WBQ03499.1 sigma-70 family RNA polymerase sigma factor [Kribbella sp. CA-293567]
MVLLIESVPMQCNTAEDRAVREAATKKLFERRERSTDETERQELLEEIVELNIEIARGIAQRFRNRGPDPEDLEQVAYLGLVKAARGYQLSAHTPFIGYAVPTIRGEVKRYFRDSAWTVRIPRRLQELQGMIGSKLPLLVQELGHEPSSAEIAERLGLEIEEVEQALAAHGCFTTLSLDRPETETGLALAEVVPDEEDASLHQLEAVDMLRPVLAELCERDRRILHLRFVEGWSQADIGADIGVSQMQVSRLLKQILSGLRASLPAVA